MSGTDTITWSGRLSLIFLKKLIRLMQSASVCSLNGLSLFLEPIPKIDRNIARLFLLDYLLNI
jgi:hypothetical protein